MDRFTGPARYIYACAPGLPRQLVEDLGPEPNPWSHDLAPREDWRRILRLDTRQPVILPAYYVGTQEQRAAWDEDAACPRRCASGCPECEEDARQPEPDREGVT